MRFGDYIVHSINANLDFNLIHYSKKHEKNPSIDFAIKAKTLNIVSENSTVDVEIFNESLTLEDPSVLYAVNSVVRMAIKKSISLARKIANNETTYPITGNNYIDRPVFFRWYSWHNDKNNGNCYDNVNHNGVLTLAVLLDKDNDLIKVGYSLCSDKDQFIRKLGNEIAWKKLNEDPVILPLEEYAEYLIAFEKKNINLTKTKNEIITKDSMNLTLKDMVIASIRRMSFVAFFVHLCVHNNGINISQALKNKIKDKFYY